MWDYSALTFARLSPLRQVLTGGDKAKLPDNVKLLLRHKKTLPVALALSWDDSRGEVDDLEQGLQSATLDDGDYDVLTMRVLVPPVLGVLLRFTTSPQLHLTS